MLVGLLYFLVGVLVIVVVVYAAHLLINMLQLPAEVKQIALLIVALIALVCLIILMVNVFSGHAVIGGWNVRW